MALTLAYRSNRVTTITREHDARTTQAQRVSEALLTARRLEKEYFFSINNANPSISTTRARTAWDSAYARLGDELQRLAPLLQTDAQREQLAEWQRIHQTYGDTFALIAERFSGESSSPQEANESKNSFNQPLQRLLDQTSGFAREQNAVADTSWNALSRQRATTITILAAIGVVAIGVSLAISASMSPRMTQPILALTESAERVAAGDLDARVAAHARHELGRLGIQFHRLDIKADLQSAVAEHMSRPLAVGRA